MVASIIILLLFVLEIVFFIKKSKYFVQYTFLYGTSITYISFKTDFIYANQGMVVFYLSIILLFFYNIKKLNKLFIPTVQSIVALIIYLIIQYAILGVNPIIQLDFVKNYYFGVFLFLIILSYKEIDLFQFNLFLAWFIIAMSLLGFSQFIFNSMSDFFSIDMTEFGAEKFNKGLLVRRVTGYFLNPANLGNIFVIIIVYLYSIYSLSKFHKKVKVIYVLAIVMGVITILLTGIRTSFFTLIIGLLLSSYFFNKKRFILFSISLPLLYIIFLSTIMSIGKSYSKEKAFETPIARLANSLYLAEDKSFRETSTLKVSDYLVTDFYNNPFIGNGTQSTLIENLSMTDAYLLYHAVRFGSIGVLILLFPYLFYLFYFRKFLVVKVFIVLLIILLLQTITDSGIFSKYSNIVFWIIFGVNITVFNKNKNLKKAKYAE